MSTYSLKELAYAAKRLQEAQLAECLDGSHLDSRPTEKQWTILRGINEFAHRYLRGGNQSSKTSLGIRECAWVFLDTHPEWKRPKEWGTEPLTMLVLGRDTRQIKESLWKRIRALLPEDTYKENYQSGSLQTVENTKNGNTIIFISHENANQAAERAQSYPAHWVWIDEMPSTFKLIEELHRRVQAKQGRFLATFTPKIVNQKIRKLVDNAKAPLAKVYRLHMFDNPIYDSEERRQEILQSMESYSESYRRTLLEGEWSLGEEMVYQYDPETMRVNLSGRYSPSWRHVLGVDPALKSKLGYTLWAEDPQTGKWFNTAAGYIEGVYDPIECVEKVEAIASGYNVVRRVCDTEPWFVGAAARLGIRYTSIYKKAHRKGELMKAWQEALGSTMFLTEWSGELEDEISSCRWSEHAEEKMVNRSSYHIIDTCHYVKDVLPKFDPALHLPSFHAQLEASHEKRKMKEAVKRKRLKSSYRSLFTA